MFPVILAPLANLSLSRAGFQRANVHANTWAFCLLLSRPGTRFAERWRFILCTWSLRSEHEEQEDVRVAETEKRNGAASHQRGGVQRAIVLILLAI